MFKKRCNKKQLTSKFNSPRQEVMTQLQCLRSCSAQLENSDVTGICLDRRVNNVTVH